MQFFVKLKNQQSNKFYAGLDHKHI